MQNGYVVYRSLAALHKYTQLWLNRNAARLFDVTLFFFGQRYNIAFIFIDNSENMHNNLLLVIYCNVRAVYITHAPTYVNYSFVGRWNMNMRSTDNWTPSRSHHLNCMELYNLIKWT